MPPGVLAVLEGCPGGPTGAGLAAQAAGKPSEAAGHDGPSRPDELVSYGLSAMSASGPEAKRRIFCSQQETFPEVQ